MVSSTVLKGFSQSHEVAEGMEGIDAALARERKWYRGAQRYQDNAAIAGGLATGALVRVVPDENLQLIRRFRNPTLEATFPPYLTPLALDALQGLGRAWRVAANKLSVPSSVRLSVTSLTRTEEYQAELVASGKFAVSDSTHVTGNAFDIDLGGYYVDLGDGKEMVVSLREPQDQAKIAQAFQDELGVVRVDPIRLGAKHYNPEVTGALLYVASALHTNEIINTVIEMPNTPNRVLHTVPRPLSLAA